MRRASPKPSKKNEQTSRNSARTITINKSKASANHKEAARIAAKKKKEGREEKAQPEKSTVKNP